jgi:hypothetical protein
VNPSTVDSLQKKKREMKSNDDEIDFDDVDLSFGGGRPRSICT